MSGREVGAVGHWRPGSDNVRPIQYQELSFKRKGLSMRKFLRHRALSCESLESRRVLASSAAFNPISGALTVTGDSGSNDLYVSNLNSYVVVQDNGVDLIA